MAQETNANVYGTTFNVDSKNVKNRNNVTVYSDEGARVRDQIPASTVQNNYAAALMCSRRKKINIACDDELNRKNKVRQRLREKLRKRQAKKTG